jgi:uncharacterized repeat protein (TIGR03803 family)
MAYLTRGKCSLAALALFGLALAAPGTHAGTLKTLYTFCQAANCTDGNIPNTGVIAGADGNLYGVTEAGGAWGQGALFELVPNAKRTKWTERVLHSFCYRNHFGCPDGAVPNGGLIQDTSGALYGVTYQGGTSLNEGIAYKLSPPAPGATKWALAILHKFCRKSGCADGQEPSNKLTYAGAETGALYDGTSPLYGVAGGGSLGGGIVYTLTPQSGAWSYRIIHAFNADPNSLDASSPHSDLLMDAAGNIYGSSLAGGASAPAGNSYGTVFKLTPRNRGTRWTERLLTSFYCDPETYPVCQNGIGPDGGLAVDETGALVEATVGGGPENAACNLQGCGLIFRTDPNGGGETTLHTFCNDANCSDGAQSAAGMGTATHFGPLVLDASGTLFGATQFGGAHGKGALFSLSGTTYSVLYDFCTLGNCADGADPSAVILDASGNIYGTASQGGQTGPGGPANGGVVFEYLP